MFERYTERARRAIFFARYEASQFGSKTIETEHLLLGLLRAEKELSISLLRSSESFESIRAEIERSTLVGERVPTSVDLPLSNESKRVLAFAAEEGEKLGHKYIETGHLLLGLLREEKCFAAKLLHDRKLSLERARAEVGRLYAPGEGRVQPSSRPRVSISEFGIDLTKQAWQGTLPKLVGREAELERMIQVLCRYTRDSVVLVGEPGVGKKTIVYGLAKRIAEGAMPSLEGKTILSLDLAVIASGIKSRSEFEDNLESILQGFYEDSNGVILFIDGLHNLAQNHRFLALANIIKPGLTDGSIQCISTATAAEYAKTVESVPWLEQRFIVIEVKAPTEAEALAILAETKERLQKFHGVTYTDEAIQYAVFHSSSYFPKQSLPEKAIDLMDEAGSRVKLRQPSLPAEVREVQKRVRVAEERQAAAITNHEFEKARYYSEELKRERENLKESRKKCGLPDEAPAVVSREDIEQIVAEQTGLSIELLRKSKRGEKTA